MYFLQVTKWFPNISRSQLVKRCALNYELYEFILHLVEYIPYNNITDKNKYFLLKFSLKWDSFLGCVLFHMWDTNRIIASAIEVHKIEFRMRILPQLCTESTICAIKKQLN